MKKYYVIFKWKDFYENEQIETKEFESSYKAMRFENKIKKQTRKLIKKYGMDGFYHPFYDINLIESEI